MRRNDSPYILLRTAKCLLFVTRKEKRKETETETKTRYILWKRVQFRYLGDIHRAKLARDSNNNKNNNNNNNNNEVITKRREKTWTGECVMGNGRNYKFDRGNKLHMVGTMAARGQG